MVAEEVLTQIKWTSTPPFSHQPCPRVGTYPTSLPLTVDRLAEDWVSAGMIRHRRIKKLHCAETMVINHHHAFSELAILAPINKISRTPAKRPLFIGIDYSVNIFFCSIL